MSKRKIVITEDGQRMEWLVPPGECNPRLVPIGTYFESETIPMAEVLIPKEERFGDEFVKEIVELQDKQKAEVIPLQMPTEIQKKKPGRPKKGA